MKVILGDNQFFGINHMSDERARAQAMRFSSNDAVLRVLRDAWEVGIRDLMLSSHARALELCEMIGQDPVLRDMVIHPVIPYAHKYAQAVAEKGLLPTLLGTAGGMGLRGVMAGGLALATRDPVRLMRSLVDAELAGYRKVKVGTVYLQNIVVDLLLGLGLPELLLEYVRHVRRSGYDGGVITMNPRRLEEAVSSGGETDVKVCVSLNHAGYLMNPDRSDVENALTLGRQPVVAMSVFAGGRLSVERAREYLAGLVREGMRIDSVVVGSSSRRHCEEAVRAFAAL